MTRWYIKTKALLINKVLSETKSDISDLKFIYYNLQLILPCEQAQGREQ